MKNWYSAGQEKKLYYYVEVHAGMNPKQQCVGWKFRWDLDRLVVLKKKTRSSRSRSDSRQRLEMAAAQLVTGFFLSRYSQK